MKAFNRYKSISSKLIIRKKPRGWFSTRPGPRPDTRRYGNDAKPSYRTTGRTSQSPKFEKTWEAPLLGKCSWSAFDVVNSVLAVRSACLKRIQFLKSGPIVEVNVYPDVEPLVYRLRPLAWSYGFLSPSSCWTDPLYLSFLSECFSKPSFFQNLLRSSFFLRKSTRSLKVRNEKEVLSSSEELPQSQAIKKKQAAFLSDSPMVKDQKPHSSAFTLSSWESSSLVFSTGREDIAKTPVEVWSQSLVFLLLSLPLGNEQVEKNDADHGASSQAIPEVVCKKGISIEGWKFPSPGGSVRRQGNKGKAAGRVSELGESPSLYSLERRD
ncbi:hypothetical protein QVD17_42316 [Tagetes erecta]|uniref:Uncharacterized protein n=1 Tax=Tagetes erecta TaxID=13708 RepID=A0AAD8N8Q1_TARER|nr:hypothetical protein QVD17_42316 [Tagetes erecta]